MTNLNFTIEQFSGTRNRYVVNFSNYTSWFASTNPRCPIIDFVIEREKGIPFISNLMYKDKSQNIIINTERQIEIDLLFWVYTRNGTSLRMPLHLKIIESKNKPYINFPPFL